MAPKKKVESTKAAAASATASKAGSAEATTGTSRLGGARATNTLAVGLVGLPNAGKSSTFNLLTRGGQPVEATAFNTTANFEASGSIPDSRFDKLVEAFKPKSDVLPTMRVWDTVGLVPDSHKGQGKGNTFLNTLSQADAIYHVCRVFPNEDQVNVPHTEGEVDPVRDLGITRKELIMKDVDTLTKLTDDIESRWRQNTKSKEGKEEHDVYMRAREVLNSNTLLFNKQDWTSRDVDILNPLQLLTAKPSVYIVNLSEKDFVRQKNKFLPKIAAWVAESGGGQIVPCSIDFELKLADLASEEARAKYMQDVGAKKRMRERIFRAVYDAIGLHHFFTAGPDEVRAWTIPLECKASQAAGAIHPAMEKGMICVELYKCSDLEEHKDEAGVKAAGKWLQKNPDYAVEDGDVLFLKFTVPTKAKS